MKICLAGKGYFSHLAGFHHLGRAVVTAAARRHRNHLGIASNSICYAKTGLTIHLFKPDRIPPPQRQGGGIVGCLENELL